MTSLLLDYGPKKDSLDYKVTHVIIYGKETLKGQGFTHIVSMSV